MSQDVQAHNLARTLASETPERINRLVTERLNKKPHRSRVKVELDFNARLVTALREHGIWPNPRR